MNTSNTKTSTTTSGTGTSVNVSTPTNLGPNPIVNSAATVMHGQLPGNAVLQSHIATTQQALNEAKFEAPLSQKGQILVDDAQQLLNSASRLITEKNADGKFQRLFSDSTHAASQTRSGVSVPHTTGGLGTSGLRGSARTMWDNGKSIGMFAIRSSQFRDILLQILDIFQTFLRTTQSKLAQQPGANVGNVAQQLAHEQVVDEQQKQQLYERIRILLTELGSRPEYYTAIDHIFMMFDQISERAKVMAPQGGNLPTTQINQTWQDTKLVVEEFSGMGTMDDFERRSYDLFNSMREDAEVQAWFRDFRSWILETIRNPALINDQTRFGYGRGIMERGRFLFQGRYRPYFQDVFDSLRLILTNIKNDSVSQDFATKLQKFGADFAFDSNGRPDLFVIQESFSQMKGILMPLLTKNLTNLPIPKVEGSNAKYDFAIEGLLLSVGDLLPEYFNLRTKSDTTLSVQRLSAQKNSMKMIMEIDRMRAVFRDVRFFYRRKRMPRIEDHGVADVDLSQGSGVSLKLVWKLRLSHQGPMQLSLLKVKCNIDRLAITVRSAKHNILDKLATKLFAGTIKRQVANAIVNNIINTVSPMSSRFNEFFKRRPLTGALERVNDGMKTTAFTGTGEPSLISKAKETVVTGLEKVREGMSHGTQNATIPPVITETTTVTPIMETTPLVTEPFTFLERDKKPYTFAWYSPSPTDVVQNVQTMPMSSEQFKTTDQTFIPSPQQQSLI